MDGRCGLFLEKTAMHQYTLERIHAKLQPGRKHAFKHRLHVTDQFCQGMVYVTGILIEMLKAKSLQMVL